MNTIKIKDVIVEIHQRHNAKYYEALFRDLLPVSDDSKTETPFDAAKAVLGNLATISREFSSPDVHKALVTFKAYISVVQGVSGIPTLIHHPDYISLRKRIVADMQECVGKDLLTYFYLYI